jgi:hypothetical protein
LSSRIRIPYPFFAFMGFNRFEMPCVTVHYSLVYWVVHATNGRAVGYIASSHLRFISALLVRWLKSHEGYTLLVLSIVIGPKWILSPLFITSPIKGIVTMSLRSIVVYHVCASLVSKVFTNDRSQF